MDEKCINCRFWEVYEVDADVSLKRGTCRRFPPVIDLLAVNEDVTFYKENGKEEPDENASCPTVWTQPKTWQDEWCGEYQPVRFNVEMTGQQQPAVKPPLAVVDPSRLPC